MEIQKIVDIWIKASVEHRILNIDYFSARTKQEHTNRDIEPDFVGFPRDGKNNPALWATFCHLREEGPRGFKPDSIKGIRVTPNSFSPSPKGRWQELIPLYEQKGLKNIDFESLM